MATNQTIHRIKADSIDDAIDELTTLKNELATDPPPSGNRLQVMAKYGLKVKVGPVVIEITIET